MYVIDRFTYRHVPDKTTSILENGWLLVRDRLGSENWYSPEQFSPDETVIKAKLRDRIDRQIAACRRTIKLHHQVIKEAQAALCSL